MKLVGTAQPKVQTTPTAHAATKSSCRRTSFRWKVAPQCAAHLARARARARVRARARATARVKVKVRFGGGGGAAVRGARDQLVRHRAREVHQGALLAGGRVGIRGVRVRGLGLGL